MKRLILVVLPLLFVVGHLFLYQKTFREKNRLEDEAKATHYVLPGQFTQIAALDFKGLAADFQLLEAIFFIGEKIEKQRPVSSSEWSYFVKLIHVVTDLDPYFYDPYYFAANTLVWGPNDKPEEAIEILEKARLYRKNDSRIPFQIGFIYFYFLNDLEKGAKYIAMAAEYPDAPPFWGTLASRLAHYAGDYEFSLALLRSLLAEARNEQIQNWYKKRIEAIEGAIALERAVTRFKVEFGRFPDNFEELEGRGIIEKLPKDPYGGNYFINKNGRVFSTSKFAETNH